MDGIEGPICSTSIRYARAAFIHLRGFFAMDSGECRKDYGILKGQNEELMSEEHRMGV